MDLILLRSLIALCPAGLLFAGAIVQFRRARSIGATLQLVGAGCLIAVVLAHIAESLRWFPEMGWGQEHSVGHYIDLSVAILSLTLFPIGYFFSIAFEKNA